MEQHPPAPKSAICKWVVLVNAAQYIERKTRIAPAGTMHSTKKSQLDTHVGARWKGDVVGHRFSNLAQSTDCAEELIWVRNRSIYIERASKTSV